MVKKLKYDCSLLVAVVSTASSTVSDVNVIAWRLVVRGVSKRGEQTTIGENARSDTDESSETEVKGVEFNEIDFFTVTLLRPTQVANADISDDENDRFNGLVTSK